MGRVNNAPSPKMKHFSHPHELQLWSSPMLTANSTTPLCSACQLPPSENMYICGPCNFILHLTCAQFPQRITHPAHKNHALTLLPVAAYPGGIFNCDACNRQGNGFSYHCGSCEYDLHVLCASKPLKFTHQSHSCQLELTFTNPYPDTKGFSCDACHKFGSKQWLYRCAACEFDVHLDCTTTTSSSPAPAPAPPTAAVVQVQVQRGKQAQLLQQHWSFPGGNFHNQVGLGQSAQYAQPHVLQHQHHQFMHSASMGANPMAHHGLLQPTPAAATGVDQVTYGPPPVVRTNVLMHSASTGQLGNVGPRPINRTSGLMNSVIQGLVEGAAQPVGQSLVQGMIGGDGGGTGGGGDGSSILGSLFADS